MSMCWWMNFSSKRFLSWRSGALWSLRMSSLVQAVACVVEVLAAREVEPMFDLSVKPSDK